MQNLVKLIDHTFEDAEAKEVALYIVARNAMIQESEKSAALQIPTVENLSPEQVRLVMQYDSNLATNAFYIANYAVIKAVVAMDELVLQSRTYHLMRAESDALSKQVVRDLYANRFGALTTVVMLSQGIEAAKQFDYILRREVSLTADEKQFFSTMMGASHG